MSSILEERAASQLDEWVSEASSYEELLASAQALTVDSDADEIDRVINGSITLKAVQKRRVQDLIKKNAGIPYSVMKEAERADVERDEVDDLQLAQELANDIGRDNVLATQAFVWQWSYSGVWQNMEDRSVKQRVQNFIADKLDKVSRSNVDSVSDLFRTEVFKEHHQFDVGPPECVNCINGELTLEDGQWLLKDHDREHYRTTQIPVEYDPEAKAPRFEQFMAEAFKGDHDADDKAKALLEMVGYSLMAHCRHERFNILVGGGANGKSVYLSVVEALAGSVNVAGVQPSQFDRSFQRAHLHNKLVNIVTEIKQGEVIDDASLKGIVSGEPTTVEHKFKDPFMMRPFATCWFGTNHMPHTRDFSDALFRRALVVEFNNTFKPELGNCDPLLKDKLMGELPGILNLALSAYANALVNGFTTPQSCRDARDKWRIEADQVAQFIDSQCERDPSAKEKPQALYDAYKRWASDNGISKQLTSTSFYIRLENHGCQKRKTNGSRFYVGLRLAEVAPYS